MATTKQYKIKSEFLGLWGIETTDSPIITMVDIVECAKIWEKPVEELLSQVEVI